VRLLYLIDSLGPGGAERSLAAMAPWYVAKGIELEVAFLHDRLGLQNELERAGVRLCSLAGPGGRPGWVRRVRRLLTVRRPDLVHTTLFEADLAGRAGARLAGVPVVSSLVNVAYGPEQAATPGVGGIKLRGALVADALTARWVVRFHANASHIADLMAPRLHIPRERVEVIPRGRDPARLGERTRERSARVRATLGAAAGGPLVLAVARHEHQKGLDVLLEALPQVLERAPEARLLVAGRDGNQTPLLDATVARLSLGGAVTFLGARDDVADLLCAADLVVIPSRWEGLSNVLIEAMALETPVVTSDLPTLTDAVDGDSALLVPPGRADRLAEAVVATLEDAVATAARVANARRRFLRSFTIDRVVDQMVAFYEQALADAGRRRSGAPLI